MVSIFEKKLRRLSEEKEREGNRNCEKLSTLLSFFFCLDLDIVSPLSAQSNTWSSLTKMQVSRGSKRARGRDQAAEGSFPFFEVWTNIEDKGCG